MDKATAGLFAKYYGPLFGGRHWLRYLPPEGRKQFSQLGLMALRSREYDLPAEGGRARAKTGCRCGRGHLISQTGAPCRACERKQAKSNGDTTN